MWFECTECGECVERARAPVTCAMCGIAGAIFVPADDSEDETAPLGWLAVEMRERGVLSRDPVR